MPTPDFDTEAIFDKDYLYFYRPVLDDEERNTPEVDLIWRLLRLQPGAQALDLGCGHGRISNRLAEHGCHTTGLDVTPLFLDHARHDATARGVSADYVHGDMRHLPWTDHFEAALSWFAAYGYFDDTDNRRVLTQVAKALKPGGRFLLELNNYLGIVRRYQHSIVAERDGDFIIDRHDLDPLTSRNRVERIIIRDGAIRRAHYFVRMFTFSEIRDWLLEAGFTTVDGYDEHGHPLSLDSNRMLVLAQR